MVLGEPHIVEPGPLGGHRRLHHGLENLAVRLPGELSRQQQHPGPEPSGIRHDFQIPGADQCEA